jgi:hypothetical protein
MSASWLFALLVQHAPPGNTAFSVEIVNDCNAATVCEGARWSDFYSAWIRKESPETGAERYSSIAGTLVETAGELLCRNPDGSIMTECTPAKGALENNKKMRWDVLTLSVAGAAVAMLESGFREDVQVGRGSARKPSKDGGRGRGPGGEGCLVQALSRQRSRAQEPRGSGRPRSARGHHRVTARNRSRVAQALLAHGPQNAGARSRLLRLGLADDGVGLRDVRALRHRHVLHLGERRQDDDAHPTLPAAPRRGAAKGEAEILSSEGRRPRPRAPLTRGSAQAAETESESASSTQAYAMGHSTIAT